ncbi:SGNH/GDSL hydrolase family protein [Empedobacter brevis]|uniref:SGNH/GDSL hydrolase family protein n=1 Tax=Empedobacter brevis TaxID=247 RepID=A0AAJ1QBD1_9FLAO|nr:SGNH/GDSL hydrolase family protein [Empedobacter brevis]MDM1070900.1 SGNH/GDSL hydrolase family protein [Empedobacter brevis]
MADLNQTVAPLSTIISWFAEDAVPTDTQFETTWKSFFHKSENIPVEQIYQLAEILNLKAERNHMHFDLAKKDGSNLDVDDINGLKEVLGVALAANGIINNIETTITSEDANALQDGIYKPKTTGVFTSIGLTAQENYTTLFKKLDGVWSVFSEEKLPTIEGVDVISPIGEEFPKEKAVALYTNEKIDELRSGVEIKFFTTTKGYIAKNTPVGSNAIITASELWKVTSMVVIKSTDVVIRKGSAVLESSATAEIHFFDLNDKYLGYLNKNLTSYEVLPTDRPTGTSKIICCSANSYAGEFSLSVKNQINSAAVKGLEQIDDLNNQVKNIDGFSSPLNGYVNNSGQVVNVDSSSVWRMTPPIKVIEGQKILVTSTTTTTGSAYPLYGYDKNMMPVSSLLSRGTNSNKEVIVPGGIDYLIGCGDNTYTLKLESIAFNQAVINSNEIVLPLVNDVFIPSKIYAKSGEAISFNINGIVNKHPNDYSRDVFFNSQNGNEDFLKVTPVADFVVPIRERLLNQNSIVLGNLNVKVKGSVINPSTPHYFMHLGDSTVRCFQNSNIEGAIVNELSRRLNGIGTSITPANAPVPLAMSNLHFIGTLGDQAVKHEGRGGWSFNNYLTVQNKSGSTNAFWNPNTNAFDLNYYLMQNSFSQISTTGDNLTILCQLGWNDVFARTQAQIEADVKAFLSLVKTSKSGIKIKLISMQLPPTDIYKAYTGTREQSYISTMQKVMSIARLYERISLDNNYSAWVEHISYMPTFFPENSYPSQEIQVNKRSVLTQKVYTDDVHPTAIGYAQMADILFYNILYNYC